MTNSEVELEKPLQDYLNRWGKINWNLDGERTAKNLLKHLEAWFGRKPRRILDIGCMNGYVMDAFIRMGYDAYGVEPMDYYKLSDNPDRILHNSIKNLTGQGFDFVYCLEVMEHIPIEEVPPSLMAIRRLLNGVGFFTISEDKEVDPTHVTIRSRDEWIRLLEEAGFTYHPDKTRFAKGFNFYCVT